MEVEGKGRVRFNVLKVIPTGSSRGGKKAFTVMWDIFFWNGKIVVSVLRDVLTIWTLVDFAFGLYQCYNF